MPSARKESLYIFSENFHTIGMKVETLLKRIKTDFGESADLLVRPSIVGGRQAYYVAIEGLTDKELLEEHVIKPLSLSEEVSPATLGEKVYLSSPVRLVKDRGQAVQSIAEGMTALLLAEESEIALFSVKKWERRSVEEPPTSSVIKGPREGFTEDVTVNAALLRRRLKSRSLVIKERLIGKYTQTKVLVCYLSDVAAEKTVDLVNERLSHVEIDGVIDSSYLTKFLEDDPSSLFPQVGTLEKPDVVAAKLLEGRVAVFTDGSPIAITIPYIIMEDFQSPSDYYYSPYNATLARFIRLFSIAVSLLFPSLFVAAELFHLQLIPLSFLLTIVSSIKGIPLSPSYEMFFTLLIFEILNEASVRMPKYVGMVVSIVGGLVLGETAVNAGIISAPTLMIVAFSGICLFTVPELEKTFSIIRLLFLFVAGSIGLYGLIAAIVFLIIYLVSFESYQTPLLAPFSPLITKDLKDSFYKGFLIEQTRRPRSIVNGDRKRLSVNKNKGEK